MNPVIAQQASSTLDAWDRRTRVGPSGPTMAADFQRFGDHRRVFADWTDRSANGEAPKAAPPRPKAEIYTPPKPAQMPDLIGTGGVTSDHDGVVWQAWRVSGHLTAFDRAKCKSTKDPNADGQSCPEGWTIYRNAAEPTYPNSIYKTSESYLLHIDAFDTLGLGKDSPVYGSVNTDSFEVLSSATKQFVTLRVPYPHGFFPRSGTGRIDDSKSGWKGKGFWGSYATYASWHIEGGKGTLPKAVKFQMRPSPLAK